MSIGLNRLRLTPQTFWSLSLPEWRAMTAPPPRGQPLTRDVFEQLMTRYPD